MLVCPNTFVKKLHLLDYMSNIWHFKFYNDNSDSSFSSDIGDINDISDSTESLTKELVSPKNRYNHIFFSYYFMLKLFLWYIFKWYK